MIKLYRITSMFLFVFMLSNVYGEDQMDYNSKAKMLLNVNNAIRKIIELGNTNSSRTKLSTEDSNQIESTVCSLKTPREIRMFTLQCWIILAHQYADDVRVDLPFQNAMWKAIDSLAKIKSEEALHELDYISKKCEFDGGDRLQFSNLLDYYKINLSQ